MRKARWCLFSAGLFLFCSASTAIANHLGGGNRGAAHTCFDSVTDGYCPEDVRNTLHNLANTIDISFNGGAGNPNIRVDPRANGEVCVFCHTPHAAKTDGPRAAPLWNRALSTAAYVMYDSPWLDSKPASAPQGVSMACLSCHDGTVAVDALINAPASGGFRGNNPQTTAGLLQPGEGSALLDPATMTMNNADRTNRGTPNYELILGGAYPTPNLGTDMFNEHPISMAMQSGPFPDPQFNRTAYRRVGSVTLIGRATGDPSTYYLDRRDAVRLYPPDGGAVPLGNRGDFVECASCHNPHTPRPLFLRLPSVPGPLAQMPSGGGQVTVGEMLGIQDSRWIADAPNAVQAICTTCHEK